MNDGQYTNLRNYLEEIASTTKQVLTEQKRTNELLAGQQAKHAPGEVVHVPKGTNIPRPSVPAGPVSVETEPPPDAFMQAVTQKVDTSKPVLEGSPVEVMPETTKRDFTVTIEDEPRATKTPKKGK